MNQAAGDREVRIEFSAEGQASVHGPLDFDTVPVLFRDLEAREKQERPLDRIDLAGVTAADSAGLALLLEWQAQAQADGRRLAVCNAPGSLMRLARLCEAVDLLDLTGREAAGSAAP